MASRKIHVFQKDPRGFKSKIMGRIVVHGGLKCAHFKRFKLVNLAYRKLIHNNERNEKDITLVNKIAIELILKLAW